MPILFSMIGASFFVYLTCIYLTGTCIHIISYNKTNCNEIIYTTDGVYGEILHTHIHSLPEALWGINSG